jgi:hypothetical protein
MAMYIATRCLVQPRIELGLRDVVTIQSPMCLPLHYWTTVYIALKAPPRLELGFQESESCVLTN